MLLLLCAVGISQELEPRSYSPAPTGTNFAIVGYGETTGSVVVDPTLPVSDVSATFSTAVLGYYHSFGLLGRQTSAAIAVPYVWGTADGLVNGAATHAYRSGLGDTRLRLAYFLVGSPALSPQEFRKRTSKTVVGASLIVSLPLGQYDPDVLVNIGSNRWAFKPEIGFSRTMRSWQMEVDLGSWFFLQNSDFFHGQVRAQAPIASVQGHVSYTFRPGLWVALDSTFYTGGRTTVNGIHKDDRQQNSRLGVTLALPLTRSQSLKFAVNRGTSVRVGGNFTAMSATYQVRWMTSK